MTLHSHGRREDIVSVQEAQEILGRWTAAVVENGEGPCRTLDLSCRVWKPSVLAEIRVFLVEHVVPHVETLKLDDVIASLPTEEGLAALEFYATVFAGAPQLSTLHLDDNALGTRGVQSLRPLLQQTPTLRCITLRNCGLAAEVSEQWEDLFSLVAPQLHTLALGRNQLGEAGAQYTSRVLRRMHALRNFAYDGSRPLEKGTMALCEALAGLAMENPTAMTRLDLTDCFLQDGSEDTHPVHALCQALKQWKNLKHLSLRDCALKSAGLDLVLQALQQAGACLVSLELSGNELEVEGAEILAAYLMKQTETLQTLLIDTNEMEDEGLAHFQDFLQQSNALQRLDVSSNLLESATVLKAKPVSRCLNTLIVTDNQLSKQSVRSLKTLYPCVEADDENELDDDDDDDEEDRDNVVDELADHLAQSAV